MLLEDKNVVIYGGAGTIGSATALVFAREGARLFLAGRTEAPLVALADQIYAAGGQADTAVVDALDEQSVTAYVDHVAGRTGRIDVSFNVIGCDVGDQGLPLTSMTADQFQAPIAAYPRSQFIAAKAAARYMTAQGHGLIMTISAPMARMPTALAGSYGVAYAAVENLSRQFAAELGPSGVRVVCLRPTGMPESARQRGSLTHRTWSRAADHLGLSLEELLEQVGAGTMRRRELAVAEVAEAAALLACDRASALTGTTANLSAGAVVD
jgi:3-oxoacyl-[acyl-carrier protein] reductase